MKQQTEQINLEKASVEELSPDSRVWQRISETIVRQKRRNRRVQAYSTIAFLVVLACAGLGYFMIPKGSDGESLYSDNLDTRPLSETRGSDAFELPGEQLSLDYVSSLTQAYIETGLTSSELETFLDCVAEVNATYSSDEASVVSQDPDSNETDVSQFNFQYDAHSQCLSNLQLPRLKARHYEEPKTLETPI